MIKGIEEKVKCNQLNVYIICVFSDYDLNK